VSPARLQASKKRLLVREIYSYSYPITSFLPEIDIKFDIMSALPFDQTEKLGYNKASTGDEKSKLIPSRTRWFCSQE
jgi:hypothetical protein